MPCALGATSVWYTVSVPASIPTAISANCSFPSTMWKLPWPLSFSSNFTSSISVVRCICKLWERDGSLPFLSPSFLGVFLGAPDRIYGAYHSFYRFAFGLQKWRKRQFLAQGPVRLIPHKTGTIRCKLEQDLWRYPGIEGLEKIPVHISRGRQPYSFQAFSPPIQLIPLGHTESRMVHTTKPLTRPGHIPIVLHNNRGPIAPLPHLEQMVGTLPIRFPEHQYTFQALFQRIEI